MHSRTLLIGAVALFCLAPLAAQQTPPLKFQLIDVKKQMTGYDANSLVKNPPTPTKVNFSRFFPKMSIAAFPPRTKGAQLPSSFKVPTVNSPITGKIPSIKGATP